MALVMWLHGRKSLFTCMLPPASGVLWYTVLAVGEEVEDARTCKTVGP